MHDVCFEQWIVYRKCFEFWYSGLWYDISMLWTDGLWFMIYGLWFMVYGMILVWLDLWPMAYGKESFYDLSIYAWLVEVLDNEFKVLLISTM